MQRPRMIDVFRQTASILAQRSTCSHRAAVGAVIFDDQNRIFGTGYNGSPHGQPHCDDVGCDLDGNNHCKRVIHAEMNAILQCGRMGQSTDGLSIFCTHSPCIRCANVIVQSGIKKVVYDIIYASDFEDVSRLFASAGVVMERYQPVAVQLNLFGGLE